jgi:heme/copper-type cytochrome/quinol oxidase subunit 2
MNNRRCIATLDLVSTIIIGALFAVVAGLLVYGAVSFRNQSSEERARADMRWEVVWTGVATVILLVIFLMVR